MSQDPARLIYIPQPQNALEFTGERFTSSVVGEILFEHWHRYIYAGRFCAGLDVLDIASGEGYGSAFVAQTARTVLGVDIDPRAVSHSENSYGRANLTFTVGSATQIPSPDEQFDVVLSMETLEHLQQHEDFLSEIKRVLRPNGVLFMSSPNTAVYSAPFEPINTHHVRELSSKEFDDLIQKNFNWHRTLGQVNIWGNALIPLNEQIAGTLVFHQHIDNRFGLYEDCCRSQFQLIVASDVPVDNLRLSLLNAVHHHAAQSVEAARLASENARLMSEVSALQASLEMERDRGRASLNAVENALQAVRVLAEKAEVKKDSVQIRP